MTDEERTELIRKRTQAETSLSALRSRLNTMEQNYDRLKTAKAGIEEAITNLLYKIPTEACFLAEIDDGDWKGQKRNWYDLAQTDIYQRSINAAYNDAVRDINAIENRLYEIEQTAGTINTEIYQTTKTIANYSRQINGR